MRTDRTDPADHLPPGEVAGRSVQLVSAEGITPARLYRWPADRVPGCYVLADVGLEVHASATCPIFAGAWTEGSS